MNTLNKEQTEELVNAINNSVQSFLSVQGNNKKKSIYKSFIEQIVNKSFSLILNEETKNVNYELINKLKQHFSGRGKSWVTISKHKNPIVWVRLNNILNKVIDEKETYSEECSNYLDKFFDLSFAYVRFYRVNKDNCLFEIRVNGCLKSSKIKIVTSHDEALQLDFLEGTPISTELELSEVFYKKRISLEPSEKALETFENINDMFKETT